jgi:hypothetical protein
MLLERLCTSAISIAGMRKLQMTQQQSHGVICLTSHMFPLSQAKLYMRKIVRPRATERLRAVVRRHLTSEDDRQKPFEKQGKLRPDAAKTFLRGEDICCIPHQHSRLSANHVLSTNTKT